MVGWILAIDAVSVVTTFDPRPRAWRIGYSLA